MLTTTISDFRKGIKKYPDSVTENYANSKNNQAMNRSLRNSAFALLTLIFIISCEEEEQPEIRMNIKNFSELNIDTLKIYTFSGEHGFVSTGLIILRNIAPGSKTEKVEYSNIQTSLMFKAYFQSDSATGIWYFPGAPADPSGYSYLPDGDYCFGIIQYDNIRDKLIIGLLSE
jgi:hypothetical protein